MCSPHHIKRSLSVCALSQDERSSKALAMKSNSQSNDYTFSRLTCHVCFAPVSASVYQDVVHVYIPYKFSSARQKEEKNHKPRKHPTCVLKNWIKTFSSLGLLFSQFPHPRRRLCCVHGTNRKAFAHSQQKLSRWYESKNFQLITFLLVTFPFSLGRSSLSVGCTACWLHRHEKIDSPK